MVGCTTRANIWILGFDNLFIPWNLVRSILGRRLELQGTLGLISWSGRTMAYTWMSSILSELSQITRESFTLLISSSWKEKVFELMMLILAKESWGLWYWDYSHGSIGHVGNTFVLEKSFPQIWMEVDLLESEGGRPAAVLVPESVAQSVVVELLPNDARQGWANLGKWVSSTPFPFCSVVIDEAYHGARKRSFRHSCAPQIKILRALVDLEDLLWYGKLNKCSGIL